MANGMSAFGTLLARGDGATPTEAFVTIAEVKDISGPGLQVDNVELSHQSSPGAYKEFVPGMIDGGEITFDINFIPDEATHIDASGGLIGDLEGRAIRNYRLTFPDTTVWTIPAYVSAFSVSEPLNDALSASVTLKVAGQPTLA